jgi:uncharacterized protein YndB with AHSA1/START domain
VTNRIEKPPAEANPAPVAPIQKNVSVDRDVATAFRFFIDNFSDWWPQARHSVSAMKEDRNAVAVRMEARVGGRIYEVDDHGDEILWGHIQTLEPGKRIVMSWHPGSGTEGATEVEFRFVSTGPDSARVELEHRNWDRLGDDALGTRDSYENGWVYVFEQCFVEEIAKFTQ